MARAKKKPPKGGLKDYYNLTQCINLMEAL